MTAPLPDAVGVEALCKRLNFVESSGGPLNIGSTTNWYRNPDGPEAAALIQSQAARIAELEAGLKPFAQAAAARDGQPDWSPTDTLVIYLRQARSLLSEGEGT